MSEVTLRGFGWRHAGRRAWAVRDVDLHIAHGERVLLLGPSGAGKSTLLAALAGLLPDDSGEQAGTAEVDGLDPRKARERVGILFQDPQTQLVMARSGDDVAFGLENRGVPAAEIWPRVSDALDRVGFPYPITRATAALSGGEAQRLALAGVLAMRPGLVLLDEPTANLDPAGAGLVREAIARSRDDDTTLIVVEHRVAEALPLIDRVVVLEPGGGVRADGAPELVFAAYGDALADAGVWVPGFTFPPRKNTFPVRSAPPPPHSSDRPHSFGAPSPSDADRPHSYGAPSPSDADRPHSYGAPWPSEADSPLGSGTCLAYGEEVSVGQRLAPVSLGVSAGELLAVTGPNGAGKSTLALALGGLLAPTSGRIHAFGDPRPPHKWRAATLAGRIGSVFQNPEHQFVTNRVADELALGPRRLGRPAGEVTATVDELLERLRLTRLAAANPYTLSGGEARRLSVATALATAPRLLVLDEPTFGQDRRTWIELVDLLAALRDDGHAIVAVTHDDAFVQTVADRTYALGASPHVDPLPRRRPA